MFGLIDIVAGALGIGFLLVAFPLGLMCTAFWIWMLIHCIRNDRLEGSERVIWALIVWLLPFIGSVLYFFIARKATPRIRST